MDRSTHSNILFFFLFFIKNELDWCTEWYLHFIGSPHTWWMNFSVKCWLNKCQRLFSNSVSKTDYFSIVNKRKNDCFVIICWKWEFLIKISIKWMRLFFITYIFIQILIWINESTKWIVIYIGDTTKRHCFGRFFFLLLSIDFCKMLIHANIWNQASAAIITTTTNNAAIISSHIDKVITKTSKQKRLFDLLPLLSFIMPS